MPARSILIIAGLFATGAIAAPTIDPQFGDHAVIQRGKPVLLSGTAAPGEQLSVSFASRTRTTTALSSGRWRAQFPAHAAGGPLTIRVSGPDGNATASDIAMGDVWLCSGQSNMEYPLFRALGYEATKAADDPDLRLMKVPHQVADTVQSSFKDPPVWKVSAPDAGANFSAACYFMVHQLREVEKVPIGAIDDSWGATPIRQWMDEASVRAGGEGVLADLVDLQQTNPTAAMRAFGDTWAAWWRGQTHDAPGQEPWHASDRLQWKQVPKIDYWDAWAPEWKSFDGAVFFRRRVTLSPAQARQGATLSLGVVDDMDQTWVNGMPVGGTNDWAAQRAYPVPEGVLKPGVNEIVLYVRDNFGPGGFAGPANQVKLAFADGAALPLGDGWQYSIIDSRVGAPPPPPWTGVASVSKIYNAMVAPFGPLGLKGVAWYQGEADVGVAGYDRRLAVWMADWRKQFRDPQLPFLVVGLAGWGKVTSKPVESGWAALINEQRAAVQRDPRAALVSAIDLGNPADIHPSDKQSVGHRLALAAEQLVYRDRAGRVGPLPISAARAGDNIVVRFTKPLQTLSGSSAISFELCGATPPSCRFADARVQGDAVTLVSDGQPVTRVRYAWADYPLVNLYDKDLLPAPVFELPVQ
jgi:sialate O-acetylesterase